MWLVLVFCTYVVCTKHIFSRSFAIVYKEKVIWNMWNTHHLPLKSFEMCAGKATLSIFLLENVDFYTGIKNINYDWHFRILLVVWIMLWDKRKYFPSNSWDGERVLHVGGLCTSCFEEVKVVTSRTAGRYNNGSLLNYMACLKLYIHRWMYSYVSLFHDMWCKNV